MKKQEKTIKTLESLEKFEIKNNAKTSILAGNVPPETCVCDGGGCTMVVHPDGSVSYTGGNWRPD